MPLKADATNPHLELCFKALLFSNMKAICVFKRPKGWQLRKSWLPLCSLGQWQTSNLFPWLGVIPNRFRQSQLHCKQNRFRLAHRCKQHTAASRSGVCERAHIIKTSKLYHNSFIRMYICHIYISLERTGAGSAENGACLGFHTLVRGFPLFPPCRSTSGSLLKLTAVCEPDELFCQIQFVRLHLPECSHEGPKSSQPSSSTLLEALEYAWAPLSAAVWSSIQRRKMPGTAGKMFTSFASWLLSISLVTNSNRNCPPEILDGLGQS